MPSRPANTPATTPSNGKIQKCSKRNLLPSSTHTTVQPAPVYSGHEPSHPAHRTRCGARAPAPGRRPRTEPGCTTAAAARGAGIGRARPVQCRAIRGTGFASALWLGGTGRPASRHRQPADFAGTGLPQALRRPGGGGELPFAVAGLAGAPAGLADLPGRVEAHRQHHPALRRAGCAPGHRPRRRAVGQGRAGVVAWRGQATAGRLRSGVRDPRQQGRAVSRAALGAHRRGRRRKPDRGDAHRRARPAGRRSHAGQRLRRLHRRRACARPELAKDRSQPAHGQLRPGAAGQPRPRCRRDPIAAVRERAGHDRSRSRPRALPDRPVDGRVLRTRLGAPPQCRSRIGL